jgi:hypothetical protein
MDADCFDNVLDCVTGNDPAVTDYILLAPAKCPRASARSMRRRWLKLAEEVRRSCRRRSPFSLQRSLRLRWIVVRPLVDLTDAAHLEGAAH